MTHFLFTQLYGLNRRNREKCPKEGVYRTNGREKVIKMSERRALSAKRRAEAEKSVR